MRAMVPPRPPGWVGAEPSRRTLKLQILWVNCMFSTGAGLPGVKLHNICGKSFFPTPLFALFISTSAYCLPVEVFIWNRCPLLTQTIFLPVERVLHYCFHFPQSQYCLPPKRRMKRGKLTWGGRSHHWSVRLSCCPDWPSLLYTRTTLMLFASESVPFLSLEMRRLYFVKNVDVVTPMSSKLPCSSPSFCPDQRTSEIKKEDLFRQNEHFQPPEQAEAFRPRVGRIWPVCFWRLCISTVCLISYCWSVGWKKWFFSLGVAAGSVAIFFTSEWIGKNLLQFVPIYNR